MARGDPHTNIYAWTLEEPRRLLPPAHEQAASVWDKWGGVGGRLYF